MPPPEWPAEFAIAVEIYNETVMLSGIDMNGYPQLTKLDTVMGYKDYEVESKERFYGYIKALHGINIKLRNERNAH